MIVATPILYKEIKTGDLIAIHYDNNHQGNDERVGFVEEIDERSILMDDLTLHRISAEERHLRRFNRIFINSVVKVEFLTKEDVETRRISKLGFFALLHKRLTGK